VAVAIAAGGTLGIDVQSFTKPDPRVARRVFAQSDRDLLDALAGEAQSHEFSRLWTIAEACAKADGTGLPLLLRGFSPIGPGDRGSWQRYSWWSGELAGGRWALASDDADSLDPQVSELPFDAILERLNERGLSPPPAGSGASQSAEARNGARSHLHAGFTGPHGVSSYP
jgi:hypothetical protein